MSHFMKVPFTSRNDIKGLARVDYDYLKPRKQTAGGGSHAISFSKYLKEQGGPTAIVANLTVLVVSDGMGDKCATRVEAAIRRNGLVRTVIDLSKQADAVRSGKPTYEWISEACSDPAVGPAAVIIALSFGKRFAVPYLNAVSSSAFDKFCDIQRALKTFVTFGVDDQVPMKTPAIRGQFYYEVTHAMRGYLRELIGDGPEEYDGIIRTSPGASLVGGEIHTSRCQGYKLYNCANCDWSQPNFQKEWVTDRYNWQDAVFDVEVQPRIDEGVVYYDSPQESTDPVMLLARIMSGQWKPFNLSAADWFIPSVSVWDHTQAVSRGYNRNYRMMGPVTCIGSGNPSLRLQRWQSAGTTRRVFVSGIRLPRHGFITKVYHYLSGDVVEFVDVPKSATARRGITVERAERMNRQLFIKEQMERRICSTWVGRLWCDPRDQERNREVSAFGATTGQFASTDISSASDWISVQLAKDVFPGGWYRAFLQTRPTRFVLNDTVNPRVLYTLAPMGCGWCFIMELAFYWAVGRVSYDYAEALGLDVVPNAIPDHFEKLARYALDHDTYHGISVRTAKGAPILLTVFGDDAEMPVEVARVYLGLCEFLGITVNTDKSFLDGPFRESCGSDWYLEPGKQIATNATPVYWPRSAMQSLEFDEVNNLILFTGDKRTTTWENGERVTTTELSKLVELQHRLWNCPQSCAYLTSLIKMLVPDMTASKVGSTNADLWADADEPIPGIFDSVTGKVRPLADGESYRMVRDPVTGDQVPVDARELHLAPVTTYSDLRYPIPDEIPSEAIDDCIAVARLDRALRFGGTYVIETQLEGGGDIPVLQAFDERSLTHVPDVEWVYKS